MNDAQRAAVIDAAKYLQHVRPLDPVELRQYVEAQPKPGAVRQVLQEHALDIGIVERPDGTFWPVDEGPARTEFTGADRLPTQYGSVLEELLEAEFGPSWPAGESGERLRERIRTFKAKYLAQSTVVYDYRTALGYALYHLPAYYASTQYVLAELFEDGLVPLDLTVLDVGAGVGGPALGLIDLLPDDALVEYHAVEPSAATGVLRPMLDATGPNVHPTIHESTAERVSPAELPTRGAEFDLILCSNVLSELAAPEAVTARYFDALGATGTMVLTAPADKNTATALRGVERTLADDGPATVYAPTVRLWRGEQPTSTAWSFAVQPDLDVPRFQTRLADHVADTDQDAAAFVNTDVQYAYSLLRRDDTRRIDGFGQPETVAKMAAAEEFVTQRVDLVGIKLSADLAEEGHPLFLVGDGSQNVDHFAVLTQETSLNSDLGTAAYGELLLFENVLVLWNDDESAYNLVVDGETIVDAG
jgi:SAM-dependent methyltransferase